jgi:hypothetical protein
MAGRKVEGGSKDSSRRRHEYNLEKDPLQTGRTEGGIDLRTRAAMGDSVSTAQRRMAGWMYLIIIALFAFIGFTVVYYMKDIIDAIYYPE